MNILVFNVGSTSLKASLFDCGTRVREWRTNWCPAGLEDAKTREIILRLLAECEAGGVDAIAHRVVHGGDHFSGPTLATRESLEILSIFDSLAPLHNPPARQMIQWISTLGKPFVQWMVFDTAFFTNLPESASRYAIPDAWHKTYRVRRYGAHGISHHDAWDRGCSYLISQPNSQIRTPAQARAITLHLGGGCSAACSVGGVPWDTTMGLTPLEGLVMATRSGDIDPSIPFYLNRVGAGSLTEISDELHRRSGLIGLCGTSDWKTIAERIRDGCARSQLAMEIYVRRIKKVIGGYYAILGGLDFVTVSGGAGENNAFLRQAIFENLNHLGIEIDMTRNASLNEVAGGGRKVSIVSPPMNPTAILVVPCDEESAIAKMVQSQNATL